LSNTNAILDRLKTYKPLKSIEKNKPAIL